MTEQIRPATAHAGGMADLAERRPAEYARYQQVFQRPVAGAQDRHRPFLAKLAASGDAIARLSEEPGQLTGFIIMTLTAAPPVYDPGDPHRPGR